MSSLNDLLCLAKPNATLINKSGHSICAKQHENALQTIHCQCQCDDDKPFDQTIEQSKQLHKDHDHIIDMLVALDFDALHKYLDQYANNSADFDVNYYVQVLFNALLDAADQLSNEQSTAHLNKQASEWGPVLALLIRAGTVNDALEASNELVDRALNEQSDESSDCLELQLAYTFQSFIELIIVEIANERKSAISQSKVLDQELDARLTAVSQAIHTVEAINQTIKDVAAQKRNEFSALELRCSTIEQELETERQNRESRRKRELIKEKTSIAQSLEQSRTLVIQLSDQLSIIRREEHRLLTQFESDRAALTAANARWSQVSMLQKEITENEIKMNQIDQQIATYQSQHEKIVAAKSIPNRPSAAAVVSPLISNSVVIECGARDLTTNLITFKSSPKLFFRLSEIPAKALTDQSIIKQSRIKLHTFVESPCFPSTALGSRSPSNASLKNPSWPSIKIDVEGLSETAMLRIDVCNADAVVDAITSPSFAAAQQPNPHSATPQNANRKSFEWPAAGTQSSCLASAHLSLAALRRCEGHMELPLLIDATKQFAGMFRIIRCDWL